MPEHFKAKLDQAGIPLRHGEGLPIALGGAGLTLEEVQLVSVHGTSFLFFLNKGDCCDAEFEFEGGDPFQVDDAVLDGPFFDSELSGEVAQDSYDSFAKCARERMDEAATRVAERQREGCQIALVGVAAKALTFVKAAGIEPDLYFDEASLKIGRFVPGSTSAIQPLTAVSNIDRETLLIIGAWNFADELREKIRRLSAESGNDRLLSTLTCLPTLREE